MKELFESDFDVTFIDDSIRTRKEFDQSWDKFVRSIEDKDEVLFYYAGHGMDVGGTNYLIPLDARPPTGRELISSLAQDFISLRKLVTDMQERTPSVAFFVIDACRDNPYATLLRSPAAKSAGLSKELLTAPTRYYGRTVLFFSADFNQSALDSVPPENHALLLKIPDGDRAKSPFAVAFSTVYSSHRNEPLILFMQYVANLTGNLAKPHDQSPQPQGFPPDGYCLVECRATPSAQISFSSVLGGRVAIRPDQGAEDQLPPAPTIQELKQRGNAVYLGKLSEAHCKEPSTSFDQPFGCEFLNKAASISEVDGRHSPAEVLSATALVNTNIRRSAPRVEGDEIFYDCRVGVVRAGAAVRFKGVAAYSSKTTMGRLFFGVIDSEIRQDCL